MARTKTWIQNTSFLLLITWIEWDPIRGDWKSSVRIGRVLYFIFCPATTECIPTLYVVCLFILFFWLLCSAAIAICILSCERGRGIRAVHHGQGSSAAGHGWRDWRDRSGARAVRSDVQPAARGRNPCFSSFLLFSRDIVRVIYLNEHLVVYRYD